MRTTRRHRRANRRQGHQDDATALIIDLRENGGGNPDTVTQLCSYLFDDKPVHLNDRLTRGIGRVLAVWTQSVANDLRFGSRKPVVILVGKETFPNRQTLNAVTHADREGKGVQPDVRVDEGKALEMAQALAAKAIAGPKK